MTGYYNTYDQYDRPSLTFISTPEFLQTKLEAQFLQNPYLLLKFKPSCACGKDFRSSGKDKADEQIKKHLSYKKYANCKPVVDELSYNLPEFVTIDQIKGTKANQVRNENLRNQIDDARRDERLLDDPEEAFAYGIHVTLDGKMFNTKNGKYLVQEKFPNVIDGYQIDKYISIKATVVNKTKVRDVRSNKTGQEYLVCEAILEDEKGDQITLTLWNDQCKQISVGDKITVRNAYAKDGQTYTQGFGYTNRRELALYKNASTITVDEKAIAQEVTAS